MPHLWHVEPPLRFEQAPFDSAMRHKRGSKIDLSHPETSCYAEQNNDGCSASPQFIDQITESILQIYDYLLITEVLTVVAEISASNASVVWPGVFPGSFPPRACCYAAIAGTILTAVNRFLNTGDMAQPRREQAPRWRRRIALPHVHNRVRHGSAARCRHVAPAVLLC